MSFFSSFIHTPHTTQRTSAPQSTAKLPPLSSRALRGAPRGGLYFSEFGFLKEEHTPTNQAYKRIIVRMMHKFAQNTCECLYTWFAGAHWKMRLFCGSCGCQKSTIRTTRGLFPVCCTSCSNESSKISTPPSSHVLFCRPTRIHAPPDPC